MAVHADNQHDIVPLRSDNAAAAADAAPVALNLCGNALVFARAVHSAYTADVMIDAHSWNAPASHGDSNPRATAIATKAQRDDRVIWG